MTDRFSPRGAGIAVTARLVGPGRETEVRLLLDTGAAVSVVDPDVLMGAGYDLATSQGAMRVVTANRVETLPIHTVASLTALGHERLRIGVIAHRLPGGSGVQRLLGLSFFRGRVLTLDFREGLVRLA
jgi:predicted aspartyl protease